MWIWGKTDKVLFEYKKQKGINTTVRHIINNDKETTDVKEINACICNFYKNLFKKNISKSDSEREGNHFWIASFYQISTLKVLTYVKVKLQKKI